MDKQRLITSHACGGRIKDARGRVSQGHPTRSLENRIEQRTWIRDGDDAGSAKVAVPVIPPHLLIIGIEREGRMRDDSVGVEASAAGLDGPAVRTAFAAREVESVGHVLLTRARLRHTPGLAGVAALHRRRIGGIWRGRRHRRGRRVDRRGRRRVDGRGRRQHGRSGRDGRRERGRCGVRGVGHDAQVVNNRFVRVEQPEEALGARPGFHVLVE